MSAAFHLLALLLLAAVAHGFPTHTNFGGIVMRSSFYNPNGDPSDYAGYSASVLLSGGAAEPRCLVSGLTGEYFGQLDTLANTVVFNWALTVPTTTRNLTVGLNATLESVAANASASGTPLLRMVPSSLLIFHGEWKAPLNFTGFVVDCFSAVQLVDAVGVNMVRNTSLHTIELTLALAANASSLGLCVVVPPRAAHSVATYYGAVYPIAGGTGQALALSFLRGLRRYTNTFAAITFDAPLSGGGGSSRGNLVVTGLRDAATPPVTLMNGIVLLASANYSVRAPTTFTARNVTAGGAAVARVLVALDASNRPGTVYRLDAWTNAVLLGWLQSLPADRDALHAQLQVAMLDEITPIVSMVNGTVVVDLGLEGSTFYNNGTLVGYIFDTQSVLAMVDEKGVDMVRSPGLHTRELNIKNSRLGYMLVTYGPSPRVSYGAVYPIVDRAPMLVFFLSQLEQSVSTGLLFTVKYAAQPMGDIKIIGTPIRTTPSPPTTTSAPPTERVIPTDAPTTRVPTFAPLPTDLHVINPSAAIPSWGWAVIGIGVAACLGLFVWLAKRSAFQPKNPARVKREHQKEMNRFDGIVRSIRSDLDRETQNQYKDNDDQF